LQLSRQFNAYAWTSEEVVAPGAQVLLDEADEAVGLTEHIARVLQQDLEQLEGEQPTTHSHSVYHLQCTLVFVFG
jgi:hypothetical protein